MNKETKEIINKEFKRMLGISYDEYEKLDYNVQQRLVSEYNKKHPNKDKETLVMIGGGDESLFIKALKGEKILTPDGYQIAGETFDENKKRWDQMMEESEKKWDKYSKQIDKELKRKQKLDVRTWLYLYINHAEKVLHTPVVEVDKKRTMDVNDSKDNQVYIFANYEEYKNYYLMYLDNIEDEVIDLAIYARGSKGQIVVLKRLCEQIIVKKQIREFYNSITQEQIEKIHKKGKLTPLEAVWMWEAFDLCVGESKSISLEDRCEYFKQNCHECLMELASHKLEHEKIELVNSDSIREEAKLILKKTKK